MSTAARPARARRPLTLWRIQARANGAILVIPEIADYEVRRELLRAGATAGLRKLDRLRSELAYAPLTTEAMHRAAALWALARRGGYATAEDAALDGDVIVAAQAQCYAGHGDDLKIATDNPSTCGGTSANRAPGTRSLRELSWRRPRRRAGALPVVAAKSLPALRRSVTNRMPDPSGPGGCGPRPGVQRPAPSRPPAPAAPGASTM